MALIDESWHRVKQSFAGWEAETGTASFEEYATRGRDDLRMPRTVAAIRLCHDWLRASLREEGDGVVATIAEAKRIKDSAALRLRGALDSLLAAAEAAPPPSCERAVDDAGHLVARVESWFEHTPHLHDCRARVRKLQAGWRHAFDTRRQEGLALYRRLAAQAEADWRAIERDLRFEEGFDPTDLARWANRTIKLGGVINRAGADFAGPYRFAMRLNGVPVAGRYENDVASAVNETQLLTRRALDDRAPWDVIAVVEGQGTIHQRNEKRLSIPGRKEKLTLETWDPTPCVTIRIVALHAGPVAVGPR